MPTDREIAIYSLGKTEGINSIAETLGSGLDDKKYIESWNKTMKLLGVEVPLIELEKIYSEFAEKIDKILKVNENKSESKQHQNNHEISKITK